MNQTLDTTPQTISPKTLTLSTSGSARLYYSLEKIDERKTRDQEDSEVSLEEIMNRADEPTKIDEFNPNCCSLNEIDTGTNLSETGTNSRTNFERLRITLRSSLFGTPSVSKTSLDQDDRSHSMVDVPDYHKHKEHKSASSLHDLSKHEAQSSTKISSEGEVRSHHSLFSRFNQKNSMKENRDSRHKIFNRFAWKEEMFYEPEEEEKDREVEPGIFHIFGSFSQYYRVGKIIGQGAHGTVKHCNKRTDGKEFAVKILNFKGDDEMRVLITNEFKNHRKLLHENIIQVYELYIDFLKNKIYMILEYVKAKDVINVISEAGDSSEAVIAAIFKQIFNAIEYMHSKGVCHRDLKPDNILIAKNTKGKGNVVKIIDFNVSKFVGEVKRVKYSSFSKENYQMWTLTGTIAYTAPEVFTNSDYTEAVDMWSAGVVLYTFLCGFEPFQAETVGELISVIKKGEYDTKNERWQKISSEARHLLSKLLDLDYKVRYSPYEALTHPWIANRKPLKVFKEQEIN